MVIGVRCILRSSEEMIQGLTHVIHEHHNLKKLDALFHSAFHFITSCGYQTQHYTLYALYLLTFLHIWDLKVQCVRYLH